MSTDVTPDACSLCGTQGVKLWREYQRKGPKKRTVVHRITLYCVTCACSREDFPIGAIAEDGTHETEIGPSDAIGWLVPAVPLPDIPGWWGYTSIPDAALKKWAALPLTKSDRSVAPSGE